MVRKGSEYVCDRCKKKMFVEDCSTERHEWFTASIEINGTIFRNVINTKTLCCKCRFELEDILDDFFDNENA